MHGSFVEKHTYEYGCRSLRKTGRSFKAMFARQAKCNQQGNALNCSRNQQRCALQIKLRVSPL